MLFRSHSTCPIRMVPAREFEALVKRVLADLGKDPAILQACVEAASRDATTSIAELQEAGVALEANEAVAIAQQLIRSVQSSR